VLGLGREALVEIDSDANYRMCADVLAERIAQDRAAGMMPMAIVATAGTTPTGSCDPLPAIADIAANQRVHLHVDAAYGGAALLSRALAPRLRGIERADSITIDPHKWMLMPNEIGSLLVKNGDWLKEAFGETPSYLADSADRHQMLPDYYRLSLQGSRRARAFRVWGVLQVLGREAIASALEQHVELISVLRDRVAAMPDFELCHDPDFALQCFRFAPAGTSPEEQDDLNRAIQRHVEASGEAWFATTVLRGRKVLRINIESFRTTEQDVHRTIDAIADAARAVLPRG
jgi:glutamate/tyrosine decarboxylase-like PLP-dependent enzyme